jgi:hypothetical protein
MDDERAARAAHRRATWVLEPIPTDEPVDTDSPVERLRRLEALRVAACVMSGRSYPGPSTREERQGWVVERIGP